MKMPMTLQEAEMFRLSLRLPISKFAPKIGLSESSWRDIKRGKTAFRPIIALAIERLAFDYLDRPNVTLPPRIAARKTPVAVASAPKWSLRNGTLHHGA